MNVIFDDPSVNPCEFLTNGILNLHVKVYCKTACDASEKCPAETSGTSLNFNQLGSNWLGNCWNRKTKNFFWWSCLWRCSLPLHHHTWIYFHVLKPFLVIIRSTVLFSSPATRFAFLGQAVNRTVITFIFSIQSKDYFVIMAFVILYWC